MATGCGVQIDGASRAGADASSSPAVDARSMPTTGGDGGGMTTVLAACMAKGYSASANLTSVYREGATEKTWLDAEAECAADVAGATHLVVLSSAAESAFVKTMRGWVGLSDRATEGTFVNVTAEPNDQRPFLSGQPDNGSGNENCVRMKQDGLDDDQCDNTHQFVCECDGRAPTP